MNKKRNFSTTSTGSVKSTSLRGIYRKAERLYMDLWHAYANEQMADMPKEFSGPNAKSAYFEQKDHELFDKEPEFALEAAAKVYASVYNKDWLIIYYNWQKYSGVGRLYRTVLNNNRG